MKVSIELGDDVLRVIDELASRTGVPRPEIIADAMRQHTAGQVLTDLFAGHSDGLAEDDATALAHDERAAMRAERPGSTGDHVVRIVIEPDVLLAAGGDGQPERGTSWSAQSAHRRPAASTSPQTPT